MENTIKETVAKYEGYEKTLFEDPSNPYESVYIRAEVSGGKLTVTDSECEHGPDGGWTHRTFLFDKENTEKAFAFLTEQGTDPFVKLSGMIDGNVRTRRFTEACDERGIEYLSRFSF